MPLLNLRYIRKRMEEPRLAEASPGENDAFVVGNERTTYPIARRFVSPLILAGKVSSVQMTSFVDEMTKIAGMPVLEDERADVLRSLLLALLGREMLPSSAMSSSLTQEERTMYGNGGQNYAQQVQDQAASQMLRDQRLTAMLSGNVQHTFR